MKINKLIIARLIKEAIHDRLANIDEAGNLAAKEAKIQKLDEERNIVEAARSHFFAAASILKEYVNPKTIDNVVKEIDLCLHEIEAAKNALTGEKKIPSKKISTSGAKKKEVKKSPKKK